MLGDRNSCLGRIQQRFHPAPPAVTLLYMHECSIQAAFWGQNMQETPLSLSFWFTLFYFYCKFFSERCNSLRLRVRRAKRTQSEETIRCWLTAELCSGLVFVTAQFVFHELKGSEWNVLPRISACFGVEQRISTISCRCI